MLAVAADITLAVAEYWERHAMTIQGALSAAVSALRVSSAQVAASADNIANANTNGYKAKEVHASTITTKQTVATGYSSGGVSGFTVEAQDPGVNIGLEMIRIITAHTAYRANLEIVRTAEEISREQVSTKA